MPQFRLLAGLLLASAAGLVQAQPEVEAFTGATILDGRGGEPIENGVLLVRDGRVEAVGAADEVEVPEDARRTALDGRVITPGFINSHGHAGQGTDDKLERYARYGITTVVSLGGESEEHVELRDNQDRPDLRRARLYVAGPVLDPASEQVAAREVEEVAELDVDWVKIRVNNGSMPQAIYGAVIENAHERGLRVAGHMVTLADSKGLLREGVDLLAHSVRDQEVDDELITYMRDNAICLSPTLTREVSTYIYESRPDFFDDPFFQREADPAVMENLLGQDSRRRAASQAEQGRAYLAMAQTNLKILSDADIGIAFGTDSGAFPGRFPGYFEHMEMSLMREAGLTPAEILHSATAGAAECMGLADELGTLEAGKWADFNVFASNPLDDIENTRTLEATWIAGNQVAREDGPR